MTSLRIALCAVASLACACADGGSMMMSMDGGGPRADADNAEVDAFRPPRDGGRVVLSCDPGMHLCGGGCIMDLPNMPENGCRRGCGEPCPTPPDGTAGCSDEGGCTSGCEPPFVEVDGACVCTPRTCEDIGYMCGAPDDGCGQPLDCGACTGGSCMDGVCACTADTQETNDSRTEVDAQPFLAMLSDSPDSEVTYDAFNIDAPDDVDWYRFDVDDNSDGGAPRLMITLDGIPEGSNYDLSAFWTCDDGTPGEACDAGAPDHEIGFGCSSASAGRTSEYVEIDSWCGHTFGSDPGVLYVRVTASRWGGSCSPYTLTVRVE